MLPLQVSDNNIVPIPFVLNTGATGSLYLGTETLRSLKKAQLIKDASGLWPHLLGTFSRGEKLMKDPFFDTLPINYEEPSIRGDVCLNVLGLLAIDILGIMHY